MGSAWVGKSVDAMLEQSIVAVYDDEVVPLFDVRPSRATQGVERAREQRIQRLHERRQASGNIGQRQMEVIGHPEEFVKGDAAAEPRESDGQAKLDGFTRIASWCEACASIDCAHRHEAGLARIDLPRRSHDRGIGHGARLLRD